MRDDVIVAVPLGARLSACRSSVSEWELSMTCRYLWQTRLVASHLVLAELVVSLSSLTIEGDEAMAVSCKLKGW